MFILLQKHRHISFSFDDKFFLKKIVSWIQIPLLSFQKKIQNLINNANANINCVFVLGFWTSKNVLKKSVLSEEISPRRIQ